MRIARWLLTVPLAALGWVTAVLSAMAMVELLNHLCPPEFLISGMCTAPWYRPAETAAFAVSAAIGAGLFVALPALVTPAHQRRVAIVAFVVGALYATWFFAAVSTGLAVPFAAAMVMGLLVALWFTRASKRAV